MNTRPTPETDKFFATFADGEYAPSHAEYYVRLQDLERERDQLRDAIRKAATEFKAVKWGWDGDCGSDEIMERLEANLPENARPHAPERSDGSVQADVRQGGSHGV